MRKLKVSEIKDFKPCKDAWEFFLKHTDKKMNDKISVLEVLNIIDSPDYKRNVADDILWLLQKMRQKRIRGARYILLTALADIMEHVLPAFEEKHPDNKRPRKAIEAIRLFRNRQISKDKLIAAAYAAYVTADAVAFAYADAAYAAVTYAAATTFHVANYTYDTAAEREWQIEHLRELLK